MHPHHRLSRAVWLTLGVCRGVVCDIRRPSVIRVAPAPLYNTFDEVRRFVSILRAAREGL
jgi:kynureninase